MNEKKPSLIHNMVGLRMEDLVGQGEGGREGGSGGGRNLTFVLHGKMVYKIVPMLRCLFHILYTKIL